MSKMSAVFLCLVAGGCFVGAPHVNRISETTKREVVKVGLNCGVFEEHRYGGGAVSFIIHRDAEQSIAVAFARCATSGAWNSFVHGENQAPQKLNPVTALNEPLIAVGFGGEWYFLVQASLGMDGGFVEWWDITAWKLMFIAVAVAVLAVGFLDSVAAGDVSVIDLLFIVPLVARLWSRNVTNPMKKKYYY